jgi:hypothetical protein
MGNPPDGEDVAGTRERVDPPRVGLRGLPLLAQLTPEVVKETGKVATTNRGRLIAAGILHGGATDRARLLEPEPESRRPGVEGLAP